MTALRGLLLLRLGISGWEPWLGGAVVLLVGVAGLRRWAEYFVTSRRVVILNGYTGREIQALAIGDISETCIKQGPIGRFFQVGTVVIQSSLSDHTLSFRGVQDPDVIKARIDALRPSESKRR